MKDIVWSYIAKSMAAAVNTDGTRMLGELLEETSNLGLGCSVKLNSFVPNEISSVWKIYQKMVQNKKD